MIEAERDENTCRKDFLPEEFVALGRTFKAMEVDAAKKRQQSGKSGDGTAGGRGKKKNLSETFAKVKQDNSKRTAAIVAAAAGISDRTFEKAEAVVAAAPPGGCRHERHDARQGRLAHQRPPRSAMHCAPRTKPCQFRALCRNFK